MKPFFIDTTLDTRSQNGLDDVLLTHLRFQRADGSIVMAPKGGTTNGLSVPRCVQNIIPATGSDWFSGVIHDSAYRKQLLVFDRDAAFPLVDTEGWFLPAFYTRKEADDLMLEALKAQGVGFVKRWVIYLALRCFGGPAYREGHKPVD